MSPTPECHRAAGTLPPVRTPTLDSECWVPPLLRISPLTQMSVILLCPLSPEQSKCHIDLLKILAHGLFKGWMWFWWFINPKPASSVVSRELHEFGGRLRVRVHEYVLCLASEGFICA